MLRHSRIARRATPEREVAMRSFAVLGGVLLLGLGCGSDTSEEPPFDAPAGDVPVASAPAAVPQPEPARGKVGRKQPATVFGWNWLAREIMIQALDGQAFVWGEYRSEGVVSYYVTPIHLIMDGSRISFDIPTGRISLREQQQNGSTSPFGPEVGVINGIQAHVSGTVNGEVMTLECTGPDCWWTGPLQLNRFSIPND
jgi:hypothetical protein